MQQLKTLTFLKVTKHYIDKFLFIQLTNKSQSLSLAIPVLHNII